MRRRFGLALVHVGLRIIGREVIFMHGAQLKLAEGLDLTDTRDVIIERCRLELIS